MRQLFKIILLIFLLLLVLSCFVACADTNESINESSIPETSDNSIESPVVSGKISGYVYTNEYAGFEFKLPDAWKYNSKKKRADLMGLSVTDMTDDYLKEKANNGDEIFDMVASCLNRDNVAVTYYKTIYVNNDLTNKFILESQKDSIINEYKKNEIIIESINETETEFAEKTYPSIDIIAIKDGVKLYQKSIMIHKDNYVIQVYITTVSENYIGDIIKNFTKN